MITKTCAPSKVYEQFVYGKHHVGAHKRKFVRNAKGMSQSDQLASLRIIWSINNRGVRVRHALPEVRTTTDTSSVGAALDASAGNPGPDNTQARGQRARRWE